jgi:hypothetical protein
MDKSYTLLAGKLPESNPVRQPFSPIVLSFLQDLSYQLLHGSLAAQHPEWGALGFWLRPKHLEQLKSDVSLADIRLGRGIIFHITPANMPVMFVYSLIISLLAGNSNIVRLSPRILSTTAPLCHLLDTLWNQPAFRSLGETNALISYQADKKDLTDTFTTRCDGRIIWGGNHSIQEIRQSPLPPQAVELVFADRYSVAILNSNTIANGSDTELKQWAHHFYNDTYGEDQNACSSPKLLFWISSSAAVYKNTQQRWWHAVAEESRSYDLQPFKVSEKYRQAWQFAMTCPELQSIHHEANRLYVYNLAALPNDITPLSGQFGQFFQIHLPSLAAVIPYMTKKVQTISTIGISADAIRFQLITNGAAGVDRIVPIGQAMDMDIIWDGINMIESLSRIIR